MGDLGETLIAGSRRINQDHQFEGFQEVNRRRKGGAIGAAKTRRLLKFFVSNIPEGSTKWDLSRFFAEYGKTDGCYLARKWDKHGKVFGFVTFSGVEDGRELERKLGKVKMGGNVLHVNVARFTKEAEPHLNRFSNPVHMKGKADPSSGPPAGKGIGTGNRWNAGTKTFREVLLNEESSGKTELVVEVPATTDAFAHCHDKALVGKAQTFQILTEMDCLLKQAGFVNVRIQYITGLYVLLVFNESGASMDFFSSLDIWSKWFSILDPWEGQVLSYERLAWLKIYGIPLNLREASVIESIGKKFGHVIKQPDIHEEDVDLSVEYLGVLVTDGSWINRKVKLSWLSVTSGILRNSNVNSLEVFCKER